MGYYFLVLFSGDCTHLDPSKILLWAWCHFLYSKYFIFPLNVKKKIFFQFMYIKDWFLSNHEGQLLLSPIQSSDVIICWVVFTSFDCFNCSCYCSARVTRMALLAGPRIVQWLEWPFLYLSPCLFSFSVCLCLDLLSAVVC